MSVLKLSDSLRPRAGSAMIVALTSAAVLASLCAATFTLVQRKYRVVHQTASWKESLLSAESGVEMAMNEVRKSLYSPDTAWAGWTRNVDPTEEPVSNQPGASGSETMSYFFTSQVFLREGEGGQRSWSKVQVDAPRSLLDRSGDQWYRIRSTGIAEVPGGAVAAGERTDLRLRKFDLRFNRRTGGSVPQPQASRVIEAIAKPVGAFRLALFGISTINLNNHNIVVDSYDSRDAQKSTGGGYDVAKRQENADIATNGTVINAGSAHVYGDAMTNGGTVLDSDNVTGEVRDDFYQEVFNVTRPAANPDPGTPAFVNNTTSIDAKPGAPANFQFSSVNLSGQSSLRIRGAADGSPTYAQIVVTGNMSTSGQGQIQLDPGVHVRLFVVGDMDITGQGFLNPNSPLALQIYGCDRPPLANGDPHYGTIKIAGNGGFCGSVYAPNYNVEMKGGGNSDSIYGAFVGNTVFMNGVQSVHYDEALADGGLISDYKIVSWFEDER